MKKAALLISIAVIPALAVWWLAVPSKHEEVIEVFEAAQMGDSQILIRKLLGSPSRTETAGKGRTVKEGLLEESYEFFLVRYAFYYDPSGRLADKYMFTSE